MKYYKSNDPVEQMDEAISILKKEVLKEYVKNKNSQVIGNKKEKTRLTIKGYCNKANMFQKVFHPAEYRYTISQLARKINMAQERNDDIISADTRIQIAERIRQEMNSLGPEQVNLGVFAIEQLLQRKNYILGELDWENNRFVKSMNRINIGIRKTTKTAGTLATDDLLEESEQIKNQYTSNNEKSKYLDYIVKKSHEMFGQEPQGIEAIGNIKAEIDENKKEALFRQFELSNNVQEMLLNAGITTGFDTPLQTAWKNIKTKIKEGFKKVISRVQRKRLTSGSKEGTLDNGKETTEKTKKGEGGETVREQVAVSDEIKRATDEVSKQYREKIENKTEQEELHVLTDDEVEIVE